MSVLTRRNEWCQMELRGKWNIWFDQPIKYMFMHLVFRWPTNQNTLMGFSQYPFSEKQKCRFVLSLHVFPRNIWKTRDWNGEFDLPADALSTPSSFHCCLSQVPITCRCLPPLLVCCARVVLECSATESRKERAGKYNHSLFRFS